MTRAIVLGAGVQGVCAALALANRGDAVTLVDEAPDCLLRASFVNEGKIHLGHVYAKDPTFDTPRLMLRAALSFAPLVERFVRHPVPWSTLMSTPYVSALVERLEAQPDAVLAFGRIDPIGRDDARLPQWFVPPPFGEAPPWTIRDSLRLLFWHPAVPFRGVFRRAVAVERDLWIPDTLDTIGADAYWVFALSLLGPLAFVPSCACRKRYYADSVSAAFRPRWRHVAEGVGRLRGFVAARGGRRRDVAVGSMGVALWGVWWRLRLLLRRLPAPAKRWLKAIAYRSTSPGQR